MERKSLQKYILQTQILQTKQMGFCLLSVETVRQPYLPQNMPNNSIKTAQKRIKAYLQSLRYMSSSFKNYLPNKEYPQFAHLSQPFLLLSPHTTHSEKDEFFLTTK